jgi:alkanesulfonate monooxygenase
VDSRENRLPVDIYSTAPQSADVGPESYFGKVAQIARWSEQAGCRGILVYTDNRLVDAWLVAQIIIENTERLRPLVAVQPVYMHPYSVAKMVASFAYIYGRAVCLNMVAGGFKTDLLALCDETPHDLRYDRLLEYTTIIKRLLSSDAPVTLSGKFYQVKNLVLTPPMRTDLFPEILMSGSSEAGVAVARTLGATAVEYPKPSADYGEAPVTCYAHSGIRIGIITDTDRDRAWQIARERFPGDRKGQLTHMMAMKVSDSQWHKQLSDLAQENRDGESLYWLWPFKNYKTLCPYLVGSHEEVSDELAKYIRAGFRKFILDIPAEEEDLEASGIVFRLAAQKAGAGVSRPPQEPPPESTDARVEASLRKEEAS